MLTKTPKKIDKLEERLTVKERLFCKNYLANNFVGKDAALTAGFSEKSAKCIAYQLLKKPRIKKYLSKRLKEVEKKLDIKFEQKIELLWKTAERCYGLKEEELERLRSGETLKGVFEFQPEALIKAVAELNKMQGHYAEQKAPDNTEEDAKKLDEEIKKHERDY